MEFMNVVRMQIQPGRFEEWRAVMAENFQAAAAMGGVPGMIEIRHVKFGEDSVCVVGRWNVRCRS